jgi:NADH:ubiquinone oxidoreductase subunit 5 (subunit L)/multisubunit Na+/H+ antiporter MnhA subunit
MEYVLLLVPFLPLAGALAALAGGSDAPRTGRVAQTSLAMAAVAAAAVVVATTIDGPVSIVHEGADGRATVGLIADRGEAILALLTAAVGTVVISFGRRSLDGDPRRNRFLVLASLLTASTATVALSATGSGIAVGWIATGAALAALVGHRHEWAPARAAMQRTRRAFAFGDVAIGAAVVIAILSVGDLDLRTVGVDAAALAADDIGLGASALDAVAVLVVVAGVARSALVPLHRWLPSTIAAPTPVSALLHAGVVNGIGVLMIRLAPAIGISTPAMVLAFVAGVLTAVIATAVMLVRADAKGALAWSTAGQMGFMTVQLAVGAFAAALFHLVGHAMYKAALFLGAGDTVSARARHRHLPHADSALSRTPRVALVGVASTLSMGAAFLAFDPHVTTAAAILVLTFGTLTTGNAINGWLRSAAPTPANLSIGIGAGAAASFAYIGGLSLFENHVADAVPYEVAGAVGPGVLVATLAVIAIGVATIMWLPGPTGSRMRRRAYVVLLGIGAPATPSRQAFATIEPPRNRTGALRPTRQPRLRPTGRILAR